MRCVSGRICSELTSYAESVDRFRWRPVAGRVGGMRLLVLGGTNFVGRAVVADALSRGAQVTVFNRGHTVPPPGVTPLRGDRNQPGGLASLATGEWDIAVDTWSAAPVAVRNAAKLLKDRVDRYAYISSRSVYTGPGGPYLTEQSPLVEASADAGADGEQVAYAPAKRGGELAAEAAFGDRTLLVRAGLILGPREDVGRLPWWLRRLAQGGPAAAPGPHDLDLQYVDARDLAQWTLDAVEAGLSGPYNVVSESGHTTMGELLDSCVQVTGNVAQLHWVTPEAVLAAGVEPWTELPIWLPPGTLHDLLHRGDVSKALAAGLRCRPVAETIADTWAWLSSLDREPPQRSDRPAPGLSAEAEARLLALGL
jgi:nucleoside-diphosphate-sugar epimerase